MSDLRVSSVRGKRAGVPPTLPDGAVVSGFMTATSFSGNVTGNVVGAVSATSASFTGDVSIAGTITYEDVSSVDSVGVITAKAGIRVGAGQSISAVSGIVTYYGDGSQLSGVESGVNNFVASGNIDNGATVVIKTDGTVGVVTGTSTPVGFGSASSFVNKSVSDINSFYDVSTGFVCVSYYDGGNGLVAVGKVDGDSLIFGSPVQFDTNIYGPAITGDSSGKIVVAYRDGNNNNYGAAKVGTLSAGNPNGPTVSFGSKVNFSSLLSQYFSATYDSNSDRVVIVYNRNSTPNGHAVVGQISGTSINFGSETSFGTNSTTLYTTVFDSTNNKVVIVYRDSTNSTSRAIVGTVSGTSISFGSEGQYDSVRNPADTLAFDSTNGKVIIFYKDVNNSSKGTAIVATVSGTSISFGGPVVFNNAGGFDGSAIFDSNSGKVVIAYQDPSDSNYGNMQLGTVNGTSISFGSKQTFQTGSYPYGMSERALTYDSINKKVIINYGINGGHGTSKSYSDGSISTNLTTENYIGIAAEAISDGATGKINTIGGTNSSQSGLTTAQTYYVQPDGTLGTSAGSPSVVAGTSISASKILVQKS